MTQNTSIPAPIKEPGHPRCRHYWLIQAAMGPESPGVCRTCGETRDFKNYVEGAGWGDSRLSNRSETQEFADVSRVVAGRVNDDTEE